MKKKWISFLKAREIMQPPEMIAKQSIPMRIYRKASVYISYPCAMLGISPDAISLLWIAIGIAASFVMWPGSYWHILAGMLLFQLSLLLDLVDGEIARYQFKKTRIRADVLGHYFDTAGHTVVKSFIVIGLGIGLWHRFDYPLYLYAGIFVGVFLLLDNFKPKIYENLIYKNRLDIIKEKEKDYSPERNKWVSLAFDFIRLDMLSLVLWAAIFDFIQYVLLFYLVAFGLQTLWHGYKSVIYFKGFTTKVKRTKS